MQGPTEIPDVHALGSRNSCPCLGGLSKKEYSMMESMLRPLFVFAGTLVNYGRDSHAPAANVFSGRSL